MALAQASDVIPPRVDHGRPTRGLLDGLTSVCDAVALTGGLFAARLPAVPATVYAVLALVALSGTGTQGNRIHPRLGDDLPRLVGALGAPLFIAGPIAAAVGSTTPFVSRIPLVVGMVLLGRALEYHEVRRARAKRQIVEPTIVLGGGGVAKRVVDTLIDHPEFGLVPVGVVDRAAALDLPVPLLGRPAQLASIVETFDIRRIIAAFGAASEHETVPVLRECDRLPVEVHILPRFFELGVVPRDPTIDDLWGLPLARLRRAALRSPAWGVKRAMDVVLSSLILCITWPLFAVTAFAVRLTSPGPIFFRQSRIGQHGEEFELLKFRTMLVNDDAARTWTVASDDRLTSVGRILRRTGLDELPQLLNVLSGSMSLVGPRPERPYFVDRFRVAVHAYDQRHRVPTGMTGWAQVHGLRGDTSIPERAVFDNYYIEHWSLWIDTVILFRTLATVLRGEGG